MSWYDDTPGPGSHDIDAPSKAVVARAAPGTRPERLCTRADATFGMRHADSQFISPAHAAAKMGEQSPGPSAYDVHKEPGTAYTFGNADRVEQAKFISAAHLSEKFGLCSPGPANCAAVSSMGSAPAVGFGRSGRAPTHAPPQYSAAPGSHEIDRGLGRGKPAYSFGGQKASRRLAAVGAKSAGHAAASPSPPATMTVVSAQRSPRTSFGQSPRWRTGSLAAAGTAAKHAPRGGEHDAAGELQQSSTGSMGLSTGSLNGSTSTLFGTASRLQGSSREPYISAEHSRSNFGSDGPGE
jgi:hypothetical protein